MDEQTAEPAEPLIFWLKKKMKSATVYFHANPCISLVAQREHICISTVEADCRSLGILWLDVKVDKKIYIFPPKIIFILAGNELSISIKVFLFLIYLTSFLLQKKYGVQQIPGVPRFTDWQFSNTHDQVTVGFTLASDWLSA